MVEGWGADCKFHSNANNETECKKSLMLGIGVNPLSTDIAQRLLKLWLIRGRGHTIAIAESSSSYHSYKFH